MSFNLRACAVQLGHRLKASFGKGLLEVKAEHLTTSSNLGPWAKATESAASGQLKGPLAQSPASNSGHLGKGTVTGTGFLMNRRGCLRAWYPLLVPIPYEVVRWLSKAAAVSHRDEPYHFLIYLMIPQPEATQKTAIFFSALYIFRGWHKVGAAPSKQLWRYQYRP